MITFVDSIDKAVEALNDQIKLLQNRADTVVAPQLELKEYTNLTKYKWSINDTSSGLNLRTECFFEKKSSYSYNILYYDTDKVLAQFDEAKEKWIADNVENRTYNKMATEHNKAQADKIRNLMEIFGVPKTYTTYAYKSSRSRTKTGTTHPAGYVGDLLQNTIVDNKYNAILKNIDDVRKTLVIYANKLKEEIRNKKLAEEKLEKEKKELHTLAIMRVRYTPDNLDSDAYEIMQNILAKNKYIKLGHYLHLNRCDWTDGCSYAKNGLDGFKIETELDQKIYDEIHGYISNWDGDGRVFRDCTYNYTELFNLADVDKTLMDDYHTMFDKVSNI